VEIGGEWKRLCVEGPVLRGHVGVSDTKACPEEAAA
jgi:hypothetical protein